MKRTLLALVLAFQAIPSHGQNVILPGDPSIDASRIEPGHSSMTYLVSAEGSWREVGTFDTELAITDSELRANTVLDFRGSADRMIGSQVVDAATFRPISSSLDQRRGRLALSFGEAVTGEFIDGETGARTSVRQSLPSPYFDYQTYSYLIRALPLRAGYRVTIPVYVHEAKDNSKPVDIVVHEVTNGTYVSQLTGEHPVWRVYVLEGHTGNRFEYLIDKATRRVWQIEITAYSESSGATFFRLVDLEKDFQPYEAQFDREAALAMINSGAATIKGTASAQLMLSINGRRNAQRGTQIVLIPDTPLYREWVALNEQRTSRDKLEPLPLPEDVAAAVKVAEVYDDNGSFEFNNLQPGQYILTTHIDYRYGYSRTVETGRSAVYYKNAYQGDSVHYGTVRDVATGEARPEMTVIVNREGETVEVKLRARKWIW
jgi:hypothetical protein